MLEVSTRRSLAPPGAPEAEFCGSLTRYLEARVDALDNDRRGGIPANVLADLASLGAFGVSLPGSAGGSDLGLSGACAVVETLARADRAIATTVGLHLGLGTRGLVAFGDESQRQRWLPELAAGRAIAAFCATEPGAGSDLSRLQTRVAPARSGWLQVDGHKIFVTNGGLAQVFTVAAASPTLGGASLIVLERGDRGLVVGAEEDKLGLRASSTTSLYFEGIEVPEDRLLGPPGQGHQLMAQILAWGRTIMASGCIGTARAAFELAGAHVSVRRQFGRTLASQPVVRRQLRDLDADLYAMHALVTSAAASAGDIALLERLSLAAKVYCSETDWSVCDRAIQLLGGLGYLEDSRAPLLLRDARITRIFEGANDVLLTRLGALELTRPRACPVSGTTADGLADEVIGVLEGWRGHGLRVLREPRALHWLGRLVVLRDVAVAIAGRDGPDEVAAHALARVVHAARVVLLERDLVAIAPRQPEARSRA